MGGRHHVRAHVGWLAVSGRCARRLEPPRRRLGHGDPPADRTGRGRAGDGPRAPPVPRGMSSITPTRARSTPRSPSESAAASRASRSPWARSAPRPRRDARSSASSRASTTRAGFTPPSATSRQPTTRGTMRPEAHRRRTPTASLERLRGAERSNTGDDQPQKLTVRESGTAPERNSTHDALSLCKRNKNLFRSPWGLGRRASCHPEFPTGFRVGCP